MAVGPPGLPKMMIAFVVRRCAIDLGREPTAAELAAWANRQGSGRDTHCLFGRAITETEASVILRHPGRLVTASSAAPHEQDDGAVAGYEGGVEMPLPDNVLRLSDARRRKRTPRRRSLPQSKRGDVTRRS